MGANTRWKYKVEIPEKKEMFVLAQTWNKQRPGKHLNFWHTVRKQVSFFTFLPNSKYNTNIAWTAALCQELEDELRKPKPCVKVVRFAVNGVYIFNEYPEKMGDVPKIPENFVIRYKSQNGVSEERIQIEEAKAQEPAPYILFGKHDGNDKEYAWKLNPDKPKRQGIQPGDRVLVWTRHGWEQVTCTRIEKVDRRRKKQAKPTNRVKKKLTPEDLAVKVR